MKTLAGVLGGMVLILAAGETAACTLFEPPPAPGETLTQSVLRRERDRQRHLRSLASHVFLARVERSAGARLRFEPVALIDGPRPASWVFVGGGDSCEAEVRPGELRIVFARRLGPEELPGDPIGWGRFAILAAVPPEGVRDPALAGALRRAARRMADD